MWGVRFHVVPVIRPGHVGWLGGPFDLQFGPGNDRPGPLLDFVRIGCKRGFDAEFLLEVLARIGNRRLSGGHLPGARPEVGHVHEAGLLQAEIDKGGLHPGEDAQHPAAVDVSCDRGIAATLDVEFRELGVLDQCDPSLELGRVEDDTLFHVAGAGPTGRERPGSAGCLAAIPGGATDCLDYRRASRGATGSFAVFTRAGPLAESTRQGRSGSRVGRTLGPRAIAMIGRKLEQRVPPGIGRSPCPRRYNRFAKHSGNFGLCRR